MSARPPAVIATFGRLDKLDAKMAHGILRYCDNVVGVLDEAHAGRRANQVIPYVGRDLPVVGTLEEAVGLGAEELVIGAAPPGGAAAPEMVSTTRAALERGLWVVHGLHNRFQEIPELAPFAERIVELRHRPVQERVGTGAAASLDATVVLTVASDCASGKMTSALELWQGLQRRGRDAVFVATGQTGMYISGNGAAIDAVTSDFLAGVTEQLVVDQADHEFIIVEGQGAILHPAYSGVTLALMHASAPSVLLFCHDLGRTKFEYFEPEFADPREEIALIETLCSYRRPAKVAGICAMTRGLDAEQAKRAMAELEDHVGLPVATPLDPDFERLIDRVAA
jgi:uncharacterized NAD-dependent epimerase/dehydratase family protein